jgi:rRNA maturation endonuclease Nob1
MSRVVRVLDTSSLIRTKTIVRVDKQWDLFQHLQAMVERGELAMPRQVIREIGEIAHPDAPGVWARGMTQRLKHPLDVEYEHLRRVMQVAPNLVEATQQKEVADPYVAALALQLVAGGQDVEVVTDDLIDHLPTRIALGTACDRLKLAHIGCQDFLTAIGF